MLASGACVTDIGGYVEGDFRDSQLPEDLDPLFHWLTRVGREALRDAGIDSARGLRAGAIAGNLGYATEALIDLAQAAYVPEVRGRKRDPRNRFSTGYPVQLMCETLGLSQGGYALDAACASSLYAIRLACDWLRTGRADLMLAGGISRCDALLIHSGFTALHALSPTGQSRPFHRDADGLIPAEGAALLVLKRLKDAESAGDRILGVIRGVGLSNDGRASGILTPAVDGQVRAMRAAYAQAGLSPSDISLIECHATGTQAGDAVELRSMSEVFAGAHDVAIGSLKANLGHLITASGAAGVMKVLAAMRHGVRPPTPNAHPLSDAFAGTPFHVPESPEPWRASNRPRRAAISSFGFGGNNAHLLLEEYVPGAHSVTKTPPPTRIAVISMAVQSADGSGTRDFVRDLFYGARSIGDAAREVRLPAAGLVFPPRDLDRALAQQTLFLRVAGEALANVKTMPAERTAVLAGIQCDAEAALPTLRLALPEHADELDSPLDAARVIGCMPNIVANRVSRQFSFAGPGFSVLAEEQSGARALEIASAWLADGEIDAAVVGASDLPAERVHRAAVPDRPGDAAVAFVLKRETDALRDGDPILTILGEGPSLASEVRKLFGNTWAASGLLEAAASVAALVNGALPDRQPYLSAPSSPKPVAEFYDVPPVERFSAASREGLLRILRGAPAEPGNVRLAIVGASREQAIEYLNKGASGPAPDGVFFATQPIPGELAFVFTGAAAAYPGMGRDLLLALPGLADRFDKNWADAQRYAGWIFDESATPPSDLQQLCGSSFLCQVHADFMQRTLALRPHAAIGLSSGETNALYALGAWQGMGAFLEEIEACGLYTTVLAGRPEKLWESWRARGIEGVRWTHYRVSAAREALDAALQNEPAVHLTIINSPGDFIIGGEANACARVAKRVVHAVPLAMELAVHCCDVQPAAQLWRELHTRPTTPPPGIRFYSNALGRAYELSADAVGEALTAQALNTVDFPRTIRQAWDDGVRIFVEHGPRNQCAQSIRAILGDLPHLAVSLDVPGRSALRQALYCAAELWAAGREVDFSWLPASPAPQTNELVFPAHPAHAPRSAEASHTMPQAPSLAPLLEPWEVEAPPLAHSAAAAMHAQMSASHQSYVAEVTRLQEAYLATASRLLATLSAPPAAPAAPAEPPTVRFSRTDLERLASGRISEVFGPAFAGQDPYPRQVRMPEPPMLLADRVPELHGEPNSMGLGSIVTETDVVANAWYMHHGYMPAGIAIESGQADLLLISWLGADRANKSERVYRLLGCDLTFHGGLPKTGETLRYDIHVDGHAQSGAIRMFFFHYACTSQRGPRLTVRDGQAGFFSDRELADSEGVLWSPATGEHTPAAKARLDAGPRLSTRRSFDAEHLRAFAEGRPADCFGPGFERALVHTRSPRFPAGQLQMLQRVTEFDPAGGPWKRGYLRAEWTFTPRDWFFEGHFRNDPCMPGTLMFEGCVQAMAFYLSALGFTLERDAWRFEPVPEVVYPLRCRGQATPASKLLTYEIFVDEVVAGREPMLFADVLCTVDGLKAFHCRRLGLRLVPDWPLDEQREELLARPEPKPVAVIDGFAYGYHSLLSCALGRASDAFGKGFERFDGPIRTPRLPSPPYHFMSRIVSANQGPAGPVGSGCEVEYDVPPDAWYFDENGSAVMPACVFLEALLQPCGWLASFAGTWLNITDHIFFRNLDGAGRFLGEIDRRTGTISTRLKMTSFSELGGMTIYAFELACRAGDRLLFDGTAVFGNFPGAALERQAGVPATDAETAWFGAPSPDAIDLAALPPQPALGKSRVRMIDRITGYWPDGGAAGLGRVRAEKDLDASQWFFKAHFFNDPVQPGSLGVEAMIQTLQVLMIRKGLHEGIANPRFEPVACGEPLAWAYRGQVVPENRRITALVEVLEASPGFARASASLWSDGKKIYAMPALAMRIVSAGPADDSVELLDPATDTWLLDHCPTYTVPALPMMSVVDRLAAASLRSAPGKVLTELRDVTLAGWISFAHGARRLKPEPTALAVWRESPRAGMSRFDVVARAQVSLAATYPVPPKPLPPLEDAEPVADPYASGELFHGPAFRVMTSLRRSPQGASFFLDAGARLAPQGALNQVLLDGATHGIPNDNLHLWSDQIPEDVVGYPVRLNRLALYGPTPRAGLVRCEVRFADSHFDVQWIVGETVWASAELVYALFPKGPIGKAPASERRAFLRDRVYLPGVGLGAFDSGVTAITSRDLAESDWLPGTLARAYALKTETPLAEIAVKQHVSRIAEVHPAEIEPAPDFSLATCARYPLNRFPVRLEREAELVRVRDGSPVPLDTAPLRAWWRRVSGIEEWPMADLHFALIERFVRRVKLTDPAGFHVLRGKPAIYLANHQVAVESILFNVIVSALSDLPIRIIAKKEHARSWIGEMIDLAQRYPGARQPTPILFFDRQDPAALPRVLEEFSGAEPASLMVHVEGTRALSARERVTKVASVFTDLAIELGLPVIPVRFVGGLPVNPLAERLEFPFEGGQQDIVIGKAIAPEDLRGLTLRGLTLKDRSRVVAEAIEALRPADEQPLPGAGPVSDVKAVLRSCAPSSEAFGEGLDPAWTRDFRAWLGEIW
jgi:acyl transferase domain-containing protein/3-hydroxymyristoyl/3-hydroxydecanoyl-(acyl carrier protein) dehydratase/1-acyl-sn-glycerol-3-phosphate acyltransferase